MWVRPCEVGSFWQTALSGSRINFDCAWIVVGSTNANATVVHTSTCVMAQRWLAITLDVEQSHTTTHTKLYSCKQSINRTRAPNKAIWNTVPHCETTNQQACLSEAHQVCARTFLQGENMWKETFHISSLITAHPNKLSTIRPFITGTCARVNLTRLPCWPLITAYCLRRKEPRIDEPTVHRFTATLATTKTNTMFTV